MPSQRGWRNAETRHLFMREQLVGFEVRTISARHGNSTVDARPDNGVKASTS